MVFHSIKPTHGWQPIETAPKEGIFLAFCPMDNSLWWWIGPAIFVPEGDEGDGGGYFSADNYPDEYVETENYSVWSCNAPEIFPTHWMPMPEPPEGSKEASDAAVLRHIAERAA